MISSRSSKICRGIAILMVIASHYAAGMFCEPVRPAAREFISTWGVYGVDIFFLLSGYGLVKSADKNGINKRYVINRLTSCYIPYFLIVGYIELVTGSLVNLESIKFLILGLGFWYICVQMAFYIFFAVAYKIGKFKEVLITIFVVWFCHYLYNAGRADFWIVSNGAFLVGIYLATIDIRAPKVFDKWYKKLILFVISSAATYGFNIMYQNSGSLAMQIHRSMAFTLAAAGACMLIDYKSVIISALGRYSIYIYLLHTYLFWKFIFINEDWNYFLAAVVCGIITLAISIGIGFSIDYNLNLLTKFIFRKNEGKSNE